MRRVPFKDEKRIGCTTPIDPAPARTIRRFPLACGTAAFRHRLAACKGDYNAWLQKGQIKFYWRALYGILSP
jgi:hypothetical protein